MIDVNADFESGLTLSYALEDGLQKFYAQLAEKVEDQEQKVLLERLAGFEDKHKAWLAEEYGHLHGDGPEPPVPPADQSTMEGGRAVSQFLDRIRPMRVRPSVDFPHPDSPMSPSVSPWHT